MNLNHLLPMDGTMDIEMMMRMIRLLTLYNKAKNDAIDNDYKKNWFRQSRQRHNVKFLTADYLFDTFSIRFCFWQNKSIVSTQKFILKHY